VTDAKGTRTTVSKPYTEQGDLLAQHAALEAGLKDANGDYLKGAALEAQVAKLNPIKKALGFEVLDSTGKVVNGAAAPAPVATPDPVPAISTKPQTVRQNGVTYTLQPDGSYQ
jgi:hypothetical protein